MWVALDTAHGLKIHDNGNNHKHREHPIRHGLKRLRPAAHK